MLGGIALGSTTAFISLAINSDPNDSGVCFTFGFAVAMLYLFARIVIKKSGPSRPDDGPAASGDQVLAAIKSRRSIYPKDFTGKIIGKETIEKILEAGNWAPTHKLTQPWRFVVVCSLGKLELTNLTIKVCRERLPADKAEKVVAKLERKKVETLDKISHYIAVCMKRCDKPDSIPEWEEMCAVAAAAQNMLLAASSLGVAGYWTSWQEAARTSPEMKKFLGLQGEGDICLGFLVLGYSDRADQYRGSRGPVQEKVVWKM